MEGLFMKAVSQTAFLALADLRRQLGSPDSAISFVRSVVCVGFLFWLLASFSIDHFLNAAFLMVPILILAPATASIASDRDAGYASILFTYPVTATRYYAAKFLALHLLLGVYLLLLVPFSPSSYCTAGLDGSGKSRSWPVGRPWRHLSSAPSGSSSRLRSAAGRPRPRYMSDSDSLSSS